MGCEGRACDTSLLNHSVLFVVALMFAVAVLPVVLFVLWKVCIVVRDSASTRVLLRASSVIYYWAI